MSIQISTPSNNTIRVVNSDLSQLGVLLDNLENLQLDHQNILPENFQEKFDDFVSQMNELSPEEQEEAITRYIDDSLAEISIKIFSGDDVNDVTELRQFATVLQEIRSDIPLLHSSTDESDGSSSSSSRLVGATLQAPSASGASIYFNVNSNLNNAGFGGIDISGMDGPTACLFSMLWMSQTPLTQAMNNYSDQIVELGSQSKVITNTTNIMSSIVSYFQSNPASSSIALFDAFGQWMTANYPNDPTMDPAPPTAQAFDESFETVLSGSSSLFQTMYDNLTLMNTQLNSIMGNSSTTVPITVAALVGGDLAVYSPSNIVDSDLFTNCPQQLFMTYFTQPSNTAGYLINGVGSPPIFNNYWTSATNSSSGTYTAATTTSSAYITGSTTTIFSQFGTQDDTTNPIGNLQVVFNSTNIGSFIGSSTAQTSSGVITLCQQAQTTANQLNSELMATQSYLGNQYSNLINTAIGMLSNLKFQF